MTQVLEPQGYKLPFFDHQVTAASSTRQFPRSDYGSFLQNLGIAPDRLQLVKQVHDDTILYTDGSEKMEASQEADGLITDARGVALGIQTADCIPVFFWDPMQRIAGLAHAGWRGVKAGIILRMIQTFQENFDSRASTLQVAFGPAIRSCCYEVGDEFEALFPRHFKRPKPLAKGHFDMIGEAADQVLSRGISKSQIFDSGICTVCQNERFFSARREKTAERILSVLLIK